MSSESPELAPLKSGSSLAHAVRHHLAIVIVCVLLGAVGGVLYAGSLPSSYTSIARVLVNPTAGNPFVPTPTAVRQDEPTSLETEAQVAHSSEVLASVAAAYPPLTTASLQRGLQVTVPPNTQVLEISFTSSNPARAQEVAQAAAKAYLANRTRRFEDVNVASTDRVRTQIDNVVSDLQTATQAAQHGTKAERTFQSQLATALRNELVSLRAQRSALQDTASPAGSIISPATRPGSSVDLIAVAAPVAGAFGGLVLGGLIALLIERLMGVVRSPREVEQLGLPVAAAVPVRRWRRRRSADADEAFDTTIRRLRAGVLELEVRPDIIAVTGPGAGGADAGVAEAVAESFARAGHRVVLVRADSGPGARDLVVEDGLAQALLYERMDVLGLLQPTLDPLLSVLPSGGSTPESRELFVADRVRAVLSPLVQAGNLVVIQAPGVDSIEGEAVVTVAQLGIVVVTPGQTRTAVLERTIGAATKVAPLAAVLVGRGDGARRARLSTDAAPVDVATERIPHGTDRPAKPHR